MAKPSILSDLSVWVRLLGASLTGQLTYRRSFLLEMAGRFTLTLLELAAVFVLFDHVDAIGGFTKWEVVYLYGVASIGLGTAELFTDGLNDMTALVRQGTLDGVLVRPLSPLLQIMARQCRPLHAGRVLQGMLALVSALVVLQWPAQPLQVAMLVVNLVSTTLVFGAIFVMGAATKIFTIQSAEAFSAFTYGGVQLAQFPLNVYPRWLQRLFVFVVPVGVTSYAPALVVLGKGPDPSLGPWAPYAVPFVTLAFVGVALLWWRTALDRYQSTGS
ncbi:MAG: ABC-2 family transporter protein [Myxococcota bacterium]